LNLPKQLKESKIRFVYLEKNDKKPIGLDWQIEGGSNYDAQAIESMLERNPGHNYGVLAGTGRLLVIDLDKKACEEGFNTLLNAIEKLQYEGRLPKTFSVTTQSGGVHFYYFLDEPSANKMKTFNLKYKLPTGETKHCGELRFKNKKGQFMNCVAPGSQINGNAYVVRQDNAITEISIDTLLGHIFDFIELPELSKEAEKQATKIIKETNTQQLNLTLEEVVDLKQFENDGEEYWGSHPVHGSTQGKNFWLNTNKQVWYCFRCNQGGNALHLFAMLEGIVTCDKVGDLKGEKFKETLKRANQKFRREVLPQMTPLDAIVQRIRRDTDYRSLAQNMVKSIGIFYDDSQLWWIWNANEYRWVLVDEIRIMNAVDAALGNVPETLEAQIKNIILEALKRESRIREPKRLSEQCVQFKDKIINIHTGEEMPATKEYFAVNPIMWSLGESEETPTIDALFGQWVGADSIKTLYQIVAFCVAQKYFIHRIFCFTGTGSNGKSRFLALIKKFIGTHNHCSTEMENIAASKFETAKTYKRLVIEMGETNFNRLSHTSKLKRMSGEDTIGYEFKNKPAFDDVNYGKILIATNTMPPTDDRTDGFYRRWLIIDFPNQFEEGKDILATIPEVEYNNLARKSVRILRELYAVPKFEKDGSIKERREAYEKHSNPLKHFIAEAYALDVNGRVPFFEFFNKYLLYLEDKRLRKVSKRELSDQLNEMGFDTEKQKIMVGEEWKNWVFVIGVKQVYGTHGTDGTDIPVGSIRIGTNRDMSAMSAMSAMTFKPIDGVLKRGLCAHCGETKQLVASDGVQFVCEGCFESAQYSG